MRTRWPRSASSAPSCHTVVDRPTPPFGCSTARTTGVALRFAERPDGATLGSTIVVTPTLLLTLRCDRDHAAPAGPSRSRTGCYGAGCRPLLLKTASQSVAI